MIRLLYFSPIPWMGLHQRPQHTAKVLSRHFRVLWVEPRTLSHPTPPAPRENLEFLVLPVFPTNAKRRVLRRLARVAASAGPLCGALGALQRKRLAFALREDSGRPALLFGHPELAHLAEAFPGSPVAYDHMDDVLGFGDPPARLRRDLEGLVRRADLVNATSERLAEGMALLGARRLLRIGNGVEWRRFAGAGDMPEPAALSTLPHPRVLYLGSVAEWFDFELLFEVANALRDFSFPVVGPLRPELAFRKKQAPPNVHFLGTKPYDEVPAGMAHSDVGIIPFLRTPLTEAVDPVKLHEYRAAGLPVLATPFAPEFQNLEPFLPL